MAKKKKLTKAERKEARLRKGKQWLLTYTGSPKKMNKHYRERFHVDAVTAAKDLQELGVNYTQEQLDQTAAELRGLSAGTVRIATFTSVAVHWLPGMMQEFQTLYPHVEFKLFNGDYHDVDRWLTDGSVDIGFITLPTALRCECIPLREDRLLAILPENHPLAKKDVCPVKEVAALPFISLLESSDDDARRALDAAGVKPNVRFTTKDDYAILAMVSQGLGVSIVPELLLQGHRDGIAVREMTPPSSRTIALAVPAGGRAGPATRRFARFAEEWVKKNDPQKL